MEDWRLSSDEISAAFKKALADAPEPLVDLEGQTYRAIADAAARKALEWAQAQVPTNWCDPLLTGDKAVFKQTEKWDGHDIEALLRGVQDRIRRAEPAKG